jgi:hypothetical protein
MLRKFKWYKGLARRRCPVLSGLFRHPKLTVNQPSYDFEGSSPSSPTNDFNTLRANNLNRRQTDIGVFKLLKTSKPTAEIYRSPSTVPRELGRISPAFPVGRVRR